MLNIAIIGSGLSGLTLAHNLKGHAKITVFEKSRGVGGRMATRYASEYKFDHGAQFFIAKTKEFKNFISPMLEEGVVKRWDARFAEIDENTKLRTVMWGEEKAHYVGAPNMNAIGKYLSKDLNIKLNSEVTKISKKDKWHLFDGQNELLGEFDWVLITAPSAQTYDLLPNDAPMKNIIKHIKMQACFSLMLGFNEDLDLGYDAALVKNYDISWISVNSSKPDRDSGCSLLVHSTNSWAEKHIDEDKDSVINFLCNETTKVVGFDVSKADFIGIQRWRYANIEKQQYNSFLDNKRKIGVCGDWCVQGRVESGYSSAMHLFYELKKHII